MKITWERDKAKLMIGDKVFTVTNNVRNEIDPVYKRALHDPKEVRYTVNCDRSKGVPYMPRKFPKGNWKITAVEYYKEAHGIESFDKNEYGLIRIRTDAHQPVTVWALDKDGGYDYATEKTVEDYGYLFHFAPFSITTLGCGRLVNQQAAIDLAEMIEDRLEHEPILLEVI